MSAEDREGDVSSPVSAAVIAGGLVLAFAGILAVSGFVAPAFLVVTLVITVQPLRTWWLSRGAPRVVAAVGALICVYGLLLLIFGSLVWSLAQLGAVLPQYSAQFAELWARVVAGLAGFGLTKDVVTAWLGSADLSGLSDLISGALQTLTSGVSTLVLLVMFVYFFTLDASGFGARMAYLDRHRPGIAGALADFGVRVRRYWVVTSVFGLVVASLDTIALVMLGVPLAFTWGVLAFVTNYIPNVGFFIGVIPPALIALVDEGPPTAVAVIVVYVLINLIIQTVIQPRITGDAVGLAPSITMLSLVFWTIILGPLGALLAVPATLLMKSLFIDKSSRFQWLAALFDSENNLVAELGQPAGPERETSGPERETPGPEPRHADAGDPES